MKKKRYADGGITINQPSQPQPLPGLSGYSPSAGGYPFQSDATSSGASSGSSGVNQTFNIQPTAQSGQPEQAMKRGGKVKAKMGRGDGCCVRGKTKGRMI
jgi:hypothetical protein